MSSAIAQISTSSTVVRRDVAPVVAYDNRLKRQKPIVM